jgi:tetratricopeptide (TPR) repeat protein
MSARQAEGRHADDGAGPKEAGSPPEARQPAPHDARAAGRRGGLCRAALCPALLGATLLWLAVPRLVASLQLLAGDPGMALLEQGRLLTPDAYQRIIASREAALAWVPDPEGLIDLGVVHLSLAQATEPRAGRRLELLSRAGHYLRAGLAQAPVDAHAWTYLAFIDTTIGDHESAARALRLSLQSGPYEPDLILPRAALGLANWAWLGASTAAAFRVEFRRAMAQAPARFVHDVVDSGQVAAVRAALRGRPEQQRGFERLVARAGPHDGGPAS